MQMENKRKQVGIHLGLLSSDPWYSLVGHNQTAMKDRTFLVPPDRDTRSSSTNPYANVDSVFCVYVKKYVCESYLSTAYFDLMKGQRHGPIQRPKCSPLVVVDTKFLYNPLEDWAGATQENFQGCRKNFPAKVFHTYTLSINVQSCVFQEGLIQDPRAYRCVATFSCLRA